jgi:hypothetical protein
LVVSYQLKGLPMKLACTAGFLVAAYVFHAQAQTAPTPTTPKSDRLPVTAEACFVGSSANIAEFLVPDLLGDLKFVAQTRIKHGITRGSILPE